MTNSQQSDETTPTTPEEATAEAPESTEAAEEKETVENAGTGETVDAVTEASATTETDSPAESAPATPPESAPAPRAEQTPAPKPAASPAAPSPAAFAAKKPSPAGLAATNAKEVGAPKVSAPPSYVTDLDEAKKFGRVEPDGHVFLIAEGEEFAVGQYPNASEEDALAYFVRKYDDLMNQVILIETRLDSGTAGHEAHGSIKHLREAIDAKQMVGDVPALSARVDAAEAKLKEHEAQSRAELEAARAAEAASREAIVAAAEELAGQDPAGVQWKNASAQMAELFEQWKSAQKSHVRLPRSTEDALWKRFRAARTTFDKHRRAFFSKLDADNSEAKAAKEALIAEAEALSTSTDWNATSAAYRELMTRWKASKRASKKDDDQLWNRFRAAQDTFFAARQAANDEIDREFGENLKVKEALLVEAQAILPVNDLGAAKKALQSIRERWEDAGKVPRGDMGRIEAGLRKVEDAVKSAEDKHWKRTNPETQARTNSMLSQLEDAIAELEADVEKARAGGDAKKLATAEEALATKQEWLNMVKRTAADMQS